MTSSAGIFSSRLPAGGRCAAQWKPASPRSWRWRSHSGSRRFLGCQRRPRPVYRGMNSATWFGIVAPKGTPAPVIATLARHIHAMQDDPDVQRSLAESGLEPLKESPEQFGVRIRRDHERFRDIVKAAKLKPE